eukprot:CAMPEP_0119305096 /NCGR_PEP_ID=MMETSP1333-20130426/6174_1 /TAXON_ID=418940 /ORGANISM="Scyphosphaera apsteinii, Strain RCC1455" /LENGTH=229 /DNA_ID=CAMNT_0007308107 /DNA_START=45 /DNA_END=734 /DNA_ORIENTATION=+
MEPPLSEHDFARLLGCSRSEFAAIKPWKQRQLVQNAGLDRYTTNELLAERAQMPQGQTGEASASGEEAPKQSVVSSLAARFPSVPHEQIAAIVAKHEEEAAAVCEWLLQKCDGERPTPVPSRGDVRKDPPVEVLSRHCLYRPRERWSSGPRELTRYLFKHPLLGEEHLLEIFSMGERAMGPWDQGAGQELMRLLPKAHVDGLTALPEVVARNGGWNALVDSVVKGNRAF